MKHIIISAGILLAFFRTGKLKLHNRMTHRACIEQNVNKFKTNQVSMEIENLNQLPNGVRILTRPQTSLEMINVECFPLTSSTFAYNEAFFPIQNHVSLKYTFIHVFINVEEIQKSSGCSCENILIRTFLYRFILFISICNQVLQL